MLTCAPAAGAAQSTWAGVWNSDFGRLTLDAGGSGSYAGFNPGTLSGNVTGNVNQGTWNQPGNPAKSGTFKFTLGASGLSFTGDWAYDSGGCGTACGWNGTCIEGACLQNGTPTGCAGAARFTQATGTCLTLTPNSVRPRLGETTSYAAPPPGEVTGLPTPVVARKAAGAVVEIETASETGIGGPAPPVVGVVLTRAAQGKIKRDYQALQLCAILALSGEIHGTSFVTCLKTVQKILDRYDKILEKQLGSSAHAAKARTCRSVKLTRRGKRPRGAVRIRCEDIATGLRLTIRRRAGAPSLRSLFGRKSRLFVGHSRFDSGAAAGDRVNVLWRSQNR